MGIQRNQEGRIPPPGGDLEKITSNIDLIDIKLTLYTLVGSVDVGKAG